MLGPRGALMGGHPARPLLGPAPHLTGSGGSVTALSGSETDVSTSTENLTQVGNIEILSTYHLIEATLFAVISFPSLNYFIL